MTKSETKRLGEFGWQELGADGLGELLEDLAAAGDAQAVQIVNRWRQRHRPLALPRRRRRSRVRYLT